MKRILLLIFTFVICFYSIGLAEEYQIPDNFNQLTEITYQTIHRSLKIDQDLSYDIYLFDEYCMSLSTITRALNGDMSLREMKDYFQKSIKKYDPANNFLLLIMVNDLSKTLDLSEFPSKIKILNSKGEFLQGTVLENYSPVFILKFSREKVKELLNANQNITIQIPIKDEEIKEIIFKQNYEEEIPEKIRELMQILKEE